MKLLLIIDCLGSGGAQRQLVYLAKGLKQLGHIVQVFEYYPKYDHFKTELVDSGIEILSCWKKSRFSVNVIKALSGIVKNNKYDAILSFLDTPNFYAEMSKINNVHCPLVVSERSTYASGHMSLGRLIRQEMHRIADKITVNSMHQKGLMEARFPWMKDKLLFIGNGVNTKVFVPKRISREGNRTNLVAIGSVTKVKNARGLIRAVEIFKKRYKEAIKITWVGNNSSDGSVISEYENVKKMIEIKNVSSEWEWLGERDEIPDIISRGNALIHPALYEGLPNVICESLACGVPVLAGDIGDNARLVDNGNRGLLFNPNDPEDMAETIYRFTKLDDSRKACMGKNAREYAEKELSLEKSILAYEKLIFEITRQNK